MNEYIEFLKHGTDLPQTPNAVIFEVGAYDGKHTRLLYDLLPSSPALFFSFEADPRRIPIVTEQTRGLQNHYVVPLAVADKLGKRTFHQSRGKDGKQYLGSSSICEPTLHRKLFPNCEFLPPIQVGCTTIDAFCTKAQTAPSVDHIDLLWADIQGAEPLMLQGAVRMLPFTKYLMLEVDQEPLYEGAWTKADFETFLAGHGDWEIRHEFEWDIIWENRAYEANRAHAGQK